jgi:hypothetical protein
MEHLANNSNEYNKLISDELEKIILKKQPFNQLIVIIEDMEENINVKINNQ